MPVITPDSLEILHRGSSTKTLVFLGDSITNGSVSSNFVTLLNKSLGDSFYLLNAGVDGDLVWNALQRIPSLIARNPDAFIILLGTNDVNASLSPENNMGYVLGKNLPQTPNFDWFTANYTSLLTNLKQSTKSTIFVLSLPTIGEDLDSFDLQQSSIYSHKIKELSSSLHVHYIPLHESMLKELQSLTNSKSVVKSFTVSSPFIFHNDELHMNDKGAAMIADLILSFIHNYL